MRHRTTAAPDAWLRLQLEATQALVTFCEQHKVRDPGWEAVLACNAALKAKDIKAAVEEFRMVPLGGNGCFNDWQLGVVIPNETPDYALAMFQALVERWSRLMSLSVEAYGA